jgi:membrane protein
LGVTLAIAVVVVTTIVLNLIGLGALADELARVMRWPAILALVVVGLAVLYRYGPSRREARWTWLSVGSLAAAIG